jgi:hypothetical protein
MAVAEVRTITRQASLGTVALAAADSLADMKA